MSVDLIQSVNVSGAVAAAGQRVRLLPEAEADLVTRRVASFVPGERSARVALAVFGDSLAENGYYYNAGATIDQFERAWGWSTWVGPMSYQRVRVVKNYSVQTNGLLVAGTSPAGYPLSVQISAALSDPEYAACTHCALCVGTNDAAGAVSIDAALAEVKRQIDRLDRPVILISSPPRTSGNTTVVGDSLATWAWLLQWRHKLKALADSSAGRITFVDAYRLGNTPGTVPDAFASGYALSDGIHWNNVYAQKVGLAVVQALMPDWSSSTLPPDVDLWPHNGYAGSTNAAALDQGFANPVLGTSTGGTAGAGATGTVASGLTAAQIASATATVSVIANPNGLGNMQRLGITSTAAGDGFDLTTATAHAAGGTFLEPGDRCYAQCLVTINSGGIYPRNLFFRLQATISGVTYNMLLWELNTSNEAALALTGTTTMLLRSPTLRVPAGGSVTSLITKFRPVFAAAGACTIDVGNIEIRRFKSRGLYS